MKPEPEFAFGKKLGVAEVVYGNIPQLTQIISKMLHCISETNKAHGTECEFFRLDFRQPYYDELSQFPHGSLILDLKFGSKKELKDKNELSNPPTDT